jgi:hypothetical protein
MIERSDAFPKPSNKRQKTVKCRLMQISKTMRRARAAGRSDGRKKVCS